MSGNPPIFPAEIVISPIFFIFSKFSASKETVSGSRSPQNFKVMCMVFGCTQRTSVDSLLAPSQAEIVWRCLSGILAQMNVRRRLPVREDATDHFVPVPQVSVIIFFFAR